MPEIHQALRARGVAIAERSVTNLLYRYEEPEALRLADQTRLREQLARQGQVILALDATIVRAHQHSAGARKKARLANPPCG